MFHIDKASSPGVLSDWRICVLVVFLATLAAGAPLTAAAMGHFTCSLVENIRLPAERPGHEDYLTHYTCRVTGGQLDGFFVRVSTRWEINGNEGKLLASIGHGTKGNAAVVYETHEGVMRNLGKIAHEPATGWDSTASAKVKVATGPVAHLSGKNFIMHGRLVAPGTFSMDAVLVK